MPFLDEVRKIHAPAVDPKEVPRDTCHFNFQTTRNKDNPRAWRTTCGEPLLGVKLSSRLHGPDGQVVTCYRCTQAIR